MRRFIKQYLTIWLDVIKDRSIFLTMVLSVVFYGFFYPFAYQAQRPADLPIVIVDEEQSPLTQAIIHTTSHTPNIHVLAVVSDFRQAQMLVQSAKADGILLLPDNLSQSIHHGQTGGVGLYLSSAYFLRTQNIGTGLASSLQATIIQELGQVTQTRHKPMPELIHQSALFNPLSGYGSYIFPAVAPIIVYQTIVLGLAMLVAGYRQRLWRASACDFLAIYAVALTIGCLSCFYLFGFVFWWHDYPRGGNFWGMMLGVPIFVSCAIGVALLIASWVADGAKVGVLLIFSSVPLFMLTGLAYPLMAMPKFLQPLANALPTTQGVQMFIQLNQMGVPIQDVWQKMAYLASVAVLCLGVAFWRLRYTTNGVGKVQKLPPFFSKKC